MFARALCSVRQAATVASSRSFSSRVRVLSERTMSHGYESAAGRYMENIQSRVMSAPGLISLETLKDVEDHTKYIVLSEVICVAARCRLGAALHCACRLLRPPPVRAHALTTHRPPPPACCRPPPRRRQWETMKHYEAWLQSDVFKEVSAKINDVTEGGKKMRVFKVPSEEIFLL